MDSPSPSTQLSDSAVDLLKRATSEWLCGNWRSLTQIECDSLKNHPERAGLALFVAAGHLQTGDHHAAETVIRIAQQWGASKNQLSRILVSSVHNHLARATALAGNCDKGLGRFERALSIGMPGCDAGHFAEIRMHHQLRELGMLPECPGRLQAIQVLGNPIRDLASANAPLPPTEPINAANLEFYQKLSRHTAQGAPPPFLLIDSKSLPRSGLHYLKNTLENLLGDQFSFCEWYQEVGCCKQHPCALTGYGTYTQETGKFRLRLIKSHDFNQTDPPLPPNTILRRLILVRDPLFTLTSWFELNELAKYKPVLLEHGIDIRKVWLMHEKEVLHDAYKILEDCFVEPSLDVFVAWLNDKMRYMSNFSNKWVKPAIEQPDPHVHLVSYEEIDQYVIDLIKPYRHALSEDSRNALEKFSEKRKQRFARRLDPFSVKVKRVEAYIRSNAHLFERAAQLVLSGMQTKKHASQIRTRNFDSISSHP